MNDMNETMYVCNNCNWQGIESELDSDEVDTCMGNDTIEVCPNCGSMNIKMLLT